MNEDLIKISPDKEKANSILKMVESSLEMIKSIDPIKFPSNLIKEYYDIIRELISVILLLDGYKVIGEGAHKRLIDYLKQDYKEFSNYEISVIDDFRVTRNKIAYDGFFVKVDYVERKRKDIENIINRLKGVIRRKLGL